MSRNRDKLRRDLLYDDPIDSGVCTQAKDRKYIDETRTVAEVHRTPHAPLSTYAVFAGHGGPTAAELCARNFVPTLLDDPALRYDPERALRNASAALEAFVLAKSALDRAYYGTTVLFVLVLRDTLYLANIGNSRAVLHTLDGAQTLNQEHDGSNPEEVARVRNAGGFFQDGRVNNLIRVTRSIGDLELKDRKHVTFPNREMTEDIVIPTPDIYVRHLSARDRFIVLATAELWETLSNKAVTTLIADALARGEPPRSAARRATTAALAGGAKGPLTVMVLVLSGSAPPPAPADRPAQQPVRRRGNRRSSLRRHSSNAEQELRRVHQQQQAGGSAGSTGSGPPAFVREAQLRELERTSGSAGGDTSGSPGGSRTGSAVAAVVACMSPAVSPAGGRVEALGTAPFLALDVPPRAKSVLGVESSSVFAAQETEMVSGRTGIDRMRVGGGVGGGVGENKGGSSGGAVHVPRLSELTASGATGAGASVGALGDAEGGGGLGGNGFGDAAVDGGGGPAKVRYREDGGLQAGALGFFKELGRTFVRRR